MVYIQPGNMGNITTIKRRDVSLMSSRKELYKLKMTEKVPTGAFPRQ
jgi:hypothetical protein